MKKNIIYIISLLIFSSGCDLDLRLTSLYRQRLYNSNKVIYEYTYHGKYDSNRFGTVLLDSTMDFSSKRKYRIETGLITKIDSNNVIESLDLSHDINNKFENDSIKTERTRYDDLIVNISYYQNKSGWGEKIFYYFDKLKESKYQVTFYGVEREYGQKLPDTVTIPKGGIWVRDTDGIVDYLQFYRLKKRGKDNSTKSQYGSINIKFYPKDTLYVNELSDYGFFKRIIETRFTTNK